MKLILTAADRPTAAEAGGKAAALARFPSLPVPAWFVVTAEAFRQSVPDPINGDFRVAPHVVEAIQDAMKHFASDEPLAVRSSAVDEDGSNQSFAGQLESYLFVPPGKAIDRIVSVWRSAFTERVYAYRAEHGLSATPSPPAVLVQRVVHSDTSGVAFAADPVSGDRSIAIISAVFGLGTSLVGGDADADVYRVSGSGEIVEQKLAHKTLSHVADPDAAGGIRTVVSEDRADEPALLPWQVKQVAQLVREVSRLEGRPQDIEWAYEGDRLFLLQSRPITSLSQVADPHGSKAIWDNSNIAESYNGVTTPLTFSFAQRAYEGAYRGFCELMKVPAKVIADNDAMFGQMLGLIRGRIYYNLLNWYRLLAMLPGFSVNQQFMEQMMGVREGLPAEIAESVLHKTWSQRQADRLRLAWSGGGLVWNHFVLPRKIKGFYKRLDHAMAPPALPLADMRLDQLTAEFRKLESQLLSRWDAPLINDFLAMIFFGVLGKTTAKWCGGDENLHNDLVSDEGGIISTEPVRRISEMASLIASDQALIDALCEADARDVEPRIAAHPAVGEKYQSYLDKFGDRCLEELKLESATLTDDATPLLRTIGQTARRNQAANQDAPKAFRPRGEAEQKVAAAMAGHPVRRRLYRWILRTARARVRDRENLRFERTRLFGRVRRIFVEIGRRLMSEGLLENDRDIFYLTLDEVLAYVEGTSVDTDLKTIASRRLAAFARFRESLPPADRFETFGAVYLGNAFTAPASETPSTGGLKGTGCCPGVVRGRVRLIRDPRGAHLHHGEILVAERTDPGWIMLFPAATGVLVERGSLLSHSAIVARELGIPAIVSIPNLMTTLIDGQTVEMNGSTGTITVIEATE